MTKIQSTIVSHKEALQVFFRLFMYPTITLRKIGFREIFIIFMLLAFSLGKRCSVSQMSTRQKDFTEGFHFSSIGRYLTSPELHSFNKYFLKVTNFLGNFFSLQDYEQIKYLGPHGAYILAGERDNKQINMLHSIR